MHVGETLTAETAELIREIGLADKMDALDFPIKYGIRIFAPAGRTQFFARVRRRDAETGLEPSYVWQVRRSVFDTLLLDHAQAHGVTVVHGRALKPIIEDDGRVRGITVRTESGTEPIDCDVLVDASGMSTFLTHAHLAGPIHRGNYDSQVSIFGHVTGAVRDDGDQWGNTLLFLRRRYEWAWLIPIDRHVDSLGFVVPAEQFRALGISPHDYFLRQLHQFNRALTKRTASATLVDKVWTSSNFSYDVAHFAGYGWVCIGDAHRFIDPHFSFGVGVAMAEGREVVAPIRDFLASPSRDAFAAFEKWARIGGDACQTVLDAFWDVPFAFGLLFQQHREDFADLLGGRIWRTPEPAALAALRAALAERHGAAAAAGA
jgi:flavin-dependent dehydrogenase